ncbi:hypothetical protein LCGC14_0510220 [marine sediment metagenome]|uniref:Uncharacterized protein n=1 Tax=marine sediment metagenome TaxID=412755 RepID=A0A0F9UN30_9ZZZZ
MEIKVKGKGITPLVTSLRVRARDDAGALSGLDIFDIEDIAGQEFDVVAVGTHTYEDRSTTSVAWLDTPAGIREVALVKLIVVEKS